MGEESKIKKQSGENLRPKPANRVEMDGIISPAIFEQAPVGMAQLGHNGTFSRINRRLEKILGYSRQELSGLRLTQLVFHEDLAYMQRLGSGAIEGRLIIKDGSVRWFKVSRTPVREAGSPKFFIAVFEDVTDHKERESELKARLLENKVQLQEIHHRVKNNMQILSSLLNLYRMKIKDEQVWEAVRECQDRIMAMALVHEVLYQSGVQSRVDLKEYIGKLAQGIWTSHSAWSRMRLSLELEQITLDLSQVVPLGLALNELLSNSIKHGFPGQRKGQVQVQASQPDKGLVVVVVEDNGVGFGPDIDWRNSESLGLKLLVGLVERQLGGTLSLDRSQGTKFTIRFKPRGNTEESKT